MSKKRKWLGTSFFWLLISLIVILILVFIVRPQTYTKPVSVSTLLSDLKTDIARQQLDTLTVANGSLTLTRGQATNAPQELPPSQIASIQRECSKRILSTMPIRKFLNYSMSQRVQSGNGWAHWEV